MKSNLGCEIVQVIELKTSFADIPIVLGVSDKPLFIELYEILRDAILDGRLEGGQVLPSTRDLARKLGVSRHTVLKSTKLLVTQGYLDSEDQSLRVFSRESSSGNSVVDTAADCDFSPPVEPSAVISASLLSSFGQSLLLSKGDARFPQSNLSPSLEDSTPLEQWRRIMVEVIKESRTACDPFECDPLGYEPLREAISKYLNRFRSTRCKPSNVVVFSGPTAALEFIARLAIDRGDSIFMEDPGFKHARDVFGSHGAQIEAVGVESDGIDVRQLAQSEKEAKFVYVTPAHQNPTGATMSLDKRRQLLKWAAYTNTTIIEDGYDSEYWHRRSRPVPAIQGLDEHGIVVYLASFWRVLLPVTRISFAVFPDSWMPVVTKYKEMKELDVNFLEQQVLTEFLERGLYERALRKNQRLLSYRRQQLVIALMKHFAQRISIATEDSGTNLIVTFKTECSTEEILDAATTASLPLVSTASYYISAPVDKQFLVPFSNLQDNSIDSIIANFAGKLPPDTAVVAPQPAPKLSFHDPFRSFVTDLLR